MTFTLAVVNAVTESRGRDGKFLNLLNLRRTDHSSRGVLTNVVRRCV